MIKTIQYCLFILLLCINNNLTAQNKKVSSFSKSELDFALDSATNYVNTNPALAFDYIEQALTSAIKNKNQEAEAECYAVIGEINFGVQQYDLAIDNYTKAIIIYAQLGNTKKEYEVKELRAKAYELENELDKSEAHYKESAIQAQNTSDVRKLKSSKKSLANIYQKKGEDAKAIQELEEVRQMDISGGNKQDQLTTNEKLIEAYSSSNTSRALELSEENEEIATKSKDTTALINTLQDRAEVYGNIGNSNEKLNVLQQSLEVRKLQKDISGQSEDNLKISEVLLEQEKLGDAIAYLEESIELSKQTGKIETRKKALKSLSVAYDKSGDFNRALMVYKQYVEVAEESASLREQKILENLELMQSLTKRLQRIDMLENQKFLNDKTIELLKREQFVREKSLKQQQIIIASLASGMLLLFITIYLVFKSSRQKRIANQLLALRSLRSQMNPHFIFNALNSVNSYISKSDERSANKYLSDFSKLMRAVMENSKYDFVSLASEVQILELYLKLENHRFKEKFDYSFIVDPKIDQENIQIPPMLIQPYIENAVWHGLRYKEEKGYLKVEIISGENLKVIIEDNGIGRKKSMELKTKNQQEIASTGLKNINNRLQIINQIHKTNLQVYIDDVNKENHTGTRVTIDIIQSN
jgi:tetratricopeptide (TPR) repeat protein